MDHLCWTSQQMPSWDKLRVVQGDTKEEFDAQAAAFGNQMVTNAKDKMGTMTVNVFPKYALHDRKQHIGRYLKKAQSMKGCVFTTRLTQINHYLSSLLLPYARDRLALFSVFKSLNEHQCGWGLVVGLNQLRKIVSELMKN